MNESKDILAINLKSAAKRLLNYWYIIAGFVLVALLVAFFYLRYSSVTYNVGASILLRIEKRNNMANTPDFLKTFDLLQDKSFQNEIFYLQSFPLVREVINKIDVRASYYLQRDGIPKRFTWSMQNIYKNSPIMVVPVEGHPQPVNQLFWIDIIDDERFRLAGEGKEVTLINFETERNIDRVADFKLEGIFRFGEIVANEHAAFRVLLNSNYDPEVLKNKDLFFRFNNLNQIAAQFKAALTIEPEGAESTVVHLSFVTENADLGKDFLTGLIDTYIEKNLGESNLLANMTIEHIEDQLENISDDLNLSEQQLQSLRASRQVMNVDDKSQNLYQELRTAQLQRDEVQRRSNLLSQMNEYFLEFKDSDSERILAPSSLGLNDPVLNNLIQELTMLNSERQRIISQNQLRNPRLVTLNISIENLKDVIAENISFGLSSTNNELAELNSRIEALNRDFSRLPQTQRDLLGVERRFRLNDATYTSLLERRIHAQIIKASNLPDAKIIEYPGYKGVASPRKTIVYIMAIFFGIAVPSIVVMGKIIIENTLSGKGDVEAITDVPIITSIPQVSDSKEKFVANFPQSSLAEAYYILRSNLIYYLHGETKKVILITSSMPGEGKSFTAINLASAFALANNKTVLLEFDLRKPGYTAHEGFNARGTPGLSSYLINKAELNEILFKTKVPNLDIIHSGQIPPNPVGLLSSPKTHELINELKQRYDYVIIDTPPYGLLSDSFLLMNHADLNIFLAKLGFTKKNLLSSNMEDLEKKKVHDLYILLNGDTDDRMKYGYNKYYKINKPRTVKGFLKRKIAIF